jgi:hypothetical protein
MTTSKHLNGVKYAFRVSYAHVPASEAEVAVQDGEYVFARQRVDECEGEWLLVIKLNGKTKGYIPKSFVSTLPADEESRLLASLLLEEKGRANRSSRRFTVPNLSDVLGSRDAAPEETVSRLQLDILGWQRRKEEYVRDFDETFASNTACIEELDNELAALTEEMLSTVAGAQELQRNSSDLPTEFPTLDEDLWKWKKTLRGMLPPSRMTVSNDVGGVAASVEGVLPSIYGIRK